MEFAHGVLLVLAPLVAACILLLHAYGARARVRALAAVSSVSGRFRRVAGGRRWAAWCTAISGALLGAALAQPLGGFTTGAAEREGRDVLVVVDVSLSMFARDHEGMSRAEVARGAVDQLIDRLSASGGHRLSLLAFCRASKPSDATRARLRRVSSPVSGRRSAQYFAPGHTSRYGPGCCARQRGHPETRSTQTLSWSRTVRITVLRCAKPVAACGPPT